MMRFACLRAGAQIVFDDLFERNRALAVLPRNDRKSSPCHWEQRVGVLGTNRLSDILL
jgi:hypothetical protein